VNRPSGGGRGGSRWNARRRTRSIGDCGMAGLPWWARHTGKVLRWRGCALEVLAWTTAVVGRLSFVEAPGRVAFCEMATSRMWRGSAATPRASAVMVQPESQARRTDVVDADDIVEGEAPTDGRQLDHDGAGPSCDGVSSSLRAVGPGTRVAILWTVSALALTIRVRFTSVVGRWCRFTVVPS
jgi:hypothetical protein